MESSFNPERIKAALTRKVGPLPLWGWGAIALGALLVWRYRQGSDATATESSYPYETDPSYYDYGPGGVGGGGNTGGGGGGKGGGGKGGGGKGGGGKGGGGKGGGGKGGGKNKGHGCPPGYTWDGKKNRCVRKKGGGNGKGGLPDNYKGHNKPGQKGQNRPNLYRPPGGQHKPGEPAVSGQIVAQTTGQSNRLTQVKPSSTKTIHPSSRTRSNVPLESNRKNTGAGRPLAGVPRKVAR